MIATHLILFFLNAGAGSAAPPTPTPELQWGGGIVPGRIPKKQKRRVLLTVKGHRFQVDEDDLPRWLALQEDEIVEKTTEQTKKYKARVRKPKAAPKIIAKTDDSRYVAAVTAANQRIAERVEAIRAGILEDIKAAGRIAAMEDDEDEDLLLLSL